MHNIDFDAKEADNSVSCRGFLPAGVVAMDARAPARPPMAMTCQSFKSLAGSPNALPACHALLCQDSIVPRHLRKTAS